MRALFLLASPLLLTLSLLQSGQARAMEVLTTIKPLQLIASAITEGGPAPELLLPPGSSPHDYALRPSDVRRVNQADLVVWIGPELEGFLTPLLASQPNSLPLLAQIDLDDHADHADHTDHADHDTRPASGHDAHDSDKITVGDHDDEHDHHGVDTHIWLDPHRAEQMATLLAERLSQLDPANSERYRKNLAAFRAGLEETDRQVAARLAPAAGIGYFVFHDAYGYWEDHYQLPSLGYFTVNPERAPGAKTLTSIHQALKQSRAQCVFAEPQFRPAVINAVARNTDARIGILDPLGAAIEVGPRGYFGFMHQLANAMAACLLNEA